MRRQNRNVLLLCDNASSHKNFDRTRLTNVQVEFLAPRLTAYIQPLDAGVIRCFKAHYHRGLLKKAIERDAAGHTEMYHIDQLEGMQLATQAWGHVRPSTISNCWRHTGICSPGSLPPVTPVLEDPVMSELQADLDIAGIPISATDLVNSDLHGQTEELVTEGMIVERVRAELG
jgi:hypothetical protein